MGKNKQAKASSKKSKITPPKDSGLSRGKLQAFRPEKHIAHRLEDYFNKSEIINEALSEYFDKWTTCSKCNGTGVLKKK